jgi:quinolinate synthase
MKKTALEDVYLALRDERHEITLDETLRLSANRCLERMLALS